MMPGLLAGDRDRIPPRQVRVVDRDRVITETIPSATLVASPAPAQADLDHRDATGAPRRRRTPSR